MKRIGERISKFDNLQEQTVKTFNELFTECPLTGFNEDDTVSIGDFTKNVSTRMLIVRNFFVDHNFQRTLKSEIQNGETNDDDSNDGFDFMFV